MVDQKSVVDFRDNEERAELLVATAFDQLAFQTMAGITRPSPTTRVGSTVPGFAADVAAPSTRRLCRWDNVVRC